MNLNSYVLVLAEDKLRHLNKTFQFFVPENWLGGLHPESLVASTLWILGRKNGEDFLYCNLSDINVGLIASKGNIGISIEGNRIESSYYYSYQHNIVSPSVDIQPLITDSLILLNEPHIKQLNVLIENIQNMSFRITSFINKRLPILNSKFPLAQEIKRLEIACREEFMFQEVPKHPKHPKEWSPYKSLAFRIASKNSNKDALSFLYAIEHALPIPTFDDKFTTINPENIKIRHYLKRKFLTNEQEEEQLRKLERAEIAHQAMLSDISKHLIFNGLKPMESRSVDLSLRYTQGIAIFEIKSATNQNVISQCRKGVCQLIEYATNLEKLGQKNEITLVVEDNGFDSILDYFDDVYKYFNGRLFRYDKSLKVEQRFKQLDDIIDSIRKNLS